MIKETYDMESDPHQMSYIPEGLGRFEIAASPTGSYNLDHAKNWLSEVHTAKLTIAKICI